MTRITRQPATGGHRAPRTDHAGWANTHSLRSSIIDEKWPLVRESLEKKLNGYSPLWHLQNDCGYEPVREDGDHARRSAPPLVIQPAPTAPPFTPTSG